MSAPMIYWGPIFNRVYKYLTTSNTADWSIDLPSVQIHDVEAAAEKRPRTLKHLLRANHINYSIIYHNLEFHNHMPDHLSSAYLLGASTEQLHKIYDDEAKDLEEWKDSPAEITASDWRNFLGDRNYQRAYVDFFEDELALKFQYDWKAVVDEYIFSGKEPLVHGLISGLAHPLIHLGYAYEVNSKEIAIEALAMGASCYNFLHKYLDDPSYTTESTYSTTSPLEILHKIAEDKRLDGLFQHRGSENIELLFEKHEGIVLEHWNAWKISDPKEQFRESQEAAVALLVSTVQPGTHSYDFFLVHLLTSSHAVRILLPLIPKKFHFSLVRGWWLFTVAVYIVQLRPKIDDSIVDTPNKQWNYVEDKAINSPWANDAHYVKAIRAIREAAFTWGDVHGRYLAAAVKFVDEFKGWTGFD